MSIHYRVEFFDERVEVGRYEGDERTAGITLYENPLCDPRGDSRGGRPVTEWVTEDDVNLWFGELEAHPDWDEVHDQEPHPGSTNEAISINAGPAQGGNGCGNRA